MNLAPSIFQGVVPSVSEVPRVPRDNHDSRGNAVLRVVGEELEEDGVDEPLVANLDFDWDIFFDQVIAEIWECEKWMFNRPAMVSEVSLYLPREILQLAAGRPELELEFVCVQ